MKYGTQGLIVLLLSGCAAQTPKKAVVKYVEVPSCPGARVELPKGCYVQSYPDRVEVRCTPPQASNVYTCTTGKKR